MENRIKPGVMSAFLTPFDEKGRVKESAIGELVDFQVQRGLNGLYVGGSTGEGMVMNVEERMQVAEAVVKAAAGRVQVIVHVGTPDTNSALELAKHAKAIGAQGISSVPPYYYKHHKQFVMDYYRELSRATDLPILAYYVPALVAGLDFGSLLELMQMPNIVGMKYTEDNFEVMYKFIEQTDHEKIVFTGHDALMLSGLCMDSNGAIGAFENVMPGGFAKVYRAFHAGDFQTAREEQLRLNHFINVMKQYMLSANQAPLKAVLRGFGVDCGVPRLPAQPLSQQAEEALLTQLRSENFFAVYP